MSSSVGMSKEKWDEIIFSFWGKPLIGEKNLLKGYYYTSVETLNKILNSGAVYSTNYRYLNDPGEWKYGYQQLVCECQSILEKEYSISEKNEFVEFMKQILGEKQYYLNDYPVGNDSPFEGNRSEIFTISFTEEEDLISQWDRYAKESGVVLEFDFSPIQQKEIFFYQETMEKKRIAVDILPQKVAYREEDVKRISQKVLETLEEEFTEQGLVPETRIGYHVYMYIRYIASYIKNAAYEQEKEMRISVYPLVTDHKTKDDIDKSSIVYTIQDGVYVPHVPLFCGMRKEDKIINCGFPIRSIRVGPGYNQESVYRGLIHRMECGNKKLYALSEEEQHAVRNRYLIEGLAEFVGIEIPQRKSNRQGLSLIMKKVNQTNGLPDFSSDEIGRFEKAVSEIYQKSRKGNLNDVSNELQMLKHDYYDKIFRKVEEKIYCTSDGILIKRSEIPYIFSKK